MQPLQQTTSFGCPSCHRVQDTLSDQDFDRFFNGTPWSCPWCSHEDNLRTILLELLKSDHPFAFGEVAIGSAVQGIGKITLVNGQILALNLTDLGVPDDADVLAVYLTPYGGDGVLVPALISHSVRRQPVGHNLTFYPVPYFGGAEETEVSVLCVWLPKSQDPSMEPLRLAVEAFTTENFRQVIVPASVTVEVALTTLLTTFFQRFSGKNRVAQFLTDAATFGYQLDPLLPALISLAGAPPLPEPVRQDISKLRKLRNKVAHAGGVISRDDAASALLAALFGYRYLRLYEPRLIGNSIS